MSHLRRVTYIHAPFETVYATAHDPKHWSDWYVGVSEERELEVGLGGSTHLMVGTPFPLTQKVLDDHLAKTEARWTTTTEGDAEIAEVGTSCRLLMLSSEQDWLYRPQDGETEVAVALDFTVPDWLADADRELVERIEAECLEQSLDNLRRLCETNH
ncbi:MAG: SRPBCC family protein [Acidobacteriota bacterium]|nr:SRPBCC family protein [Acidobacteriota bacterium]